MHTRNEIVIQADPQQIYRLAAEVERWPILLPHYRDVRVLAGRGNRRLIAMAAHRDGIPVRWQAVQQLDPGALRISYRHVRGVTTGMDVLWSLTPDPGGVHVAIDHDFEPGWPVIGRFVAERVIGQFFVANIAGKTLNQIKQLAGKSR